MVNLLKFEEFNIIHIVTTEIANFVCDDVTLLYGSFNFKEGGLLTPKY